MEFSRAQYHGLFICCAPLAYIGTWSNTLQRVRVTCYLKKFVLYDTFLTFPDIAFSWALCVPGAIPQKTYCICMVVGRPYFTESETEMCVCKKGGGLTNNRKWSRVITPSR